MATQAHAAYCLETLAAELEDRPTLSFQRVQELWEQFNAEKASEQLQVTAGVDPVEDADEDEGLPETTSPPSQRLQLPSISRLQGLSPVSNSSSSSASTTSSNTALAENSRSSSNSSFFSLGRSKQTFAATAQSEAYPLFVTWNTVSRRTGNKSLRGCIGTFDAKEVTSGLHEYALVAAFKDNRFTPISLHELPSLSCSVTLLTNFTSGSSPFDWTIGTHGIRISFIYANQRIGATYLPDVMPEQGWSKEEALVSLMRKAGWNGRSRDWKDSFEKGKGTLVRYEGRKASLDWAEWNEWRQWTRKMGYS